MRLAEHRRAAVSARRRVVTRVRIKTECFDKGTLVSRCFLASIKLVQHDHAERRFAVLPNRRVEGVRRSDIRRVDVLRPATRHCSIRYSDVFPAGRLADYGIELRLLRQLLELARRTPMLGHFDKAVAQLYATTSVSNVFPSLLQAAVDFTRHVKGLIVKKFSGVFLPLFFGQFHGPHFSPSHYARKRVTIFYRSLLRGPTRCFFN